MTIARSKLVDTSVSRWYHCISRCVRRAFLLSEGNDGENSDRKAWIENRLQELADIFAISVGGFSVMDNHLHVRVRIDEKIAKDWTNAELITRWHRLYPPRGTDRKPLTGKQLKVIVDQRLSDAAWLASARERLASLGWFMKCLKEPLARMVNKAEKCTGAFFEGRFKSIAILDDEALLSVCAYIDLNPVAAGIAKAPECSPNTSVKQRVDHVKQQGRTEDLAKALEGSVAGSKASSKLELDLWLIPIEDRRGQGEARDGMLDGFSLGSYLMLVEYTGRLLRTGKAKIGSELAEVFARLGCSAERWQMRMNKLSGGRMLGRYFAGSRERLREAAEKLGVHHLANLAGCAAT